MHNVEIELVFDESGENCVIFIFIIGFLLSLLISRSLLSHKEGEKEAKHSGRAQDKLASRCSSSQPLRGSRL